MQRILNVILTSHVRRAETDAEAEANAEEATLRREAEKNQSREAEQNQKSSAERREQNRGAEAQRHRCVEAQRRKSENRQSFV